MRNDAVAVICSRIKSSRLPQKAFLRLGGKTAIRHCLERLCRIGVPVVLAVPHRELEAYRDQCEGLDVDLMDGDPDSPLRRTSQVLRHFPGARYVIRATHDDPLLDAEEAIKLLDGTVKAGAGYGVTEGLVTGGGVEVIDRERLDWAAARYHDKPGEFISYYVKGTDGPNPTSYRVKAFPSLDRPYRLTLDYPEDYFLLDAVLSALGPDSNLGTVCAHLDRHPELSGTNQLPDVSFYTCAHNAGRFVASAMDSVAANLGHGNEYVVVNDGSTDGTLLEILRWKGKMLSPRWLRIVHRAENLGLAYSSNEAMRASRGKYLLRLDADDRLVPGSVERMLKAAEDTGADLVYCAYQEVGPDGYTPLGDPKPNDERHAGCALMRRSFLEEVRFKSGLRLGDSKDLWDRARETARVVVLPEVGWVYRKHEASLTARARSS